MREPDAAGHARQPQLHVGHPPSRSRRPRAWGVLTSPRQRRGRSGGRAGGGRVTVGSGREMSPSARCFLFFFSSRWTRPPYRRTSAFPSMSRFVRFFFLHPPSFLPVSSPFHSVVSRPSAAGRRFWRKKASKYGSFLNP
ncbi:hypothetical protein PVAP13_9KG081220 [Panicum virgatum]|uniref:Uncharacterized protein n=1 Tax=Panicum virgatum TaxID=38727 RepID=A0A8T0NJS7_PANVG|nr:hypothetical protein PVAP13_9KG081220 [Panicum virgatum]